MFWVIEIQSCVGYLYWFDFHFLVLLHRREIKLGRRNGVVYFRQVLWASIHLGFVLNNPIILLRLQSISTIIGTGIPGNVTPLMLLLVLLLLLFDVHVGGVHVAASLTALLGVEGWRLGGRVDYLLLRKRVDCIYMAEQCCYFVLSPDALVAGDPRLELVIREDVLAGVDNTGPQIRFGGIELGSFQLTELCTFEV